jgi:hypothetical protein
LIECFWILYHFHDVSLHLISGLHPTLCGKTKEERNTS